jgi:hypothetical protein
MVFLKYPLHSGSGINAIAFYKTNLPDLPRACRVGGHRVVAQLHRTKTDNMQNKPNFSLWPSVPGACPGLDPGWQKMQNKPKILRFQPKNKDCKKTNPFPPLCFRCPEPVPDSIWVGKKCKTKPIFFIFNPKTRLPAKTNPNPYWVAPSSAACGCFYKTTPKLTEGKSSIALAKEDKAKICAICEICGSVTCRNRHFMV